MNIKGVILAGGHGTRLYPMTKIFNKSLLPIYDKPMIMYSLETLKQVGCKEIMIVSGRDHSGQIMSQLGSGVDYGVALTYRVQEKPGGIAQALGICKNFVGTDPVAVCLGDNIFEDEINIEDYSGNGAYIFLKSVPDPERFGVAEVAGESVVNIVEKPSTPISDLCVTGLYVYDSYVWNIIDGLKPSGRGELEITDVNNWYVKNGLMKFKKLNGFWSDAGTPDSLAKATKLVMEKNNE
jgi:glucose-1-phosphate thymidylyltransferase